MWRTVLPPDRHRDARSDRARGAAGFTLFEVLIASTILAFATLGLVQAVTAGQAQTLDALKRARATALAESLLEEVLSKPYADPEGSAGIGPDAGESGRSDYDNVDDYHGYALSSGSLVDMTGTAYPDGYQGFDLSIAVQSETVTLATMGGDHAGMRVTVQVSEPGGGRDWIVTRFVPEPSP